MNCIIAGSRHFGTVMTGEVCAAIERAPFVAEITAVFSGCAPGVDAIGEFWATQRGLPVHRFPANWKLYSKAAGPIRNAEMASMAHALILVWDGKSKGSKNMLEIATRQGLLIHPVELVEWGSIIGPRVNL